MNTVLTLTTEGYHPGTGALINSLAFCDFQGLIKVHYLGKKPKWSKSEMEALGDRGITLQLIQERDETLPHYLKAKILLEALREAGHGDKVFFIDSDITIVRNWRFFEIWVDQGVALGADVNFEGKSINHPMRGYWRTLLKEIQRPIREISGYANSGFVGVTKEHIELIEVWNEAIHTYAKHRGGYTIRPRADQDFGFFTIDQDLLNAAIMGCDIPISLAGKEAMSLNGRVGWMIHSLGPKKPWHGAYLKDLILKGKKLGIGVDSFLEHTSEPIRVFAPFSRGVAKFEAAFTKFLSRILSAN